MAQTSTPRHELISGEEKDMGRSNLKVDFNKLQCPPGCEVIVEILRHHFFGQLLTTSCTVPEVYIIQFWKHFEPSKDRKTVQTRIDSRDIQFTADDLRTALGLPNEGSKEVKKFTPPPSQYEVLQFLRKLGYDESERVLANATSVNRKHIPQPWLTLYAILTNCVTGKLTGHEHCSLEFLQLIWGLVNDRTVDYAQFIWKDFLL